MEVPRPTFTAPPRVSLDALLASMGVGAAAGAIAGLVWGGIGGRLAMRIVFLTSDPGLRGVISDDGFEIGRFSGNTIFLLGFTLILGGLVGVVFGAIRALVAAPDRVLAPVIGVTAAAFGGGGIVHSGGIDFKILEPLWLTVGLFVLIPALWGFTVVPLATRLSPLLLKTNDPPTAAAGRAGRIAGWLFLAAVYFRGATDLVDDIADLV